MLLLCCYEELDDILVWLLSSQQPSDCEYRQRRVLASIIDEVLAVNKNPPEQCRILQMISLPSTVTLHAQSTLRSFFETNELSQQEGILVTPCRCWCLNTL